MKYGHFDDQKREYVITRPDTPLPWINYIGCQDYFGILSATAGGYSYYRDARMRRLTRGRYNNVPTDFGGRYVYLRDNASGDFWSPSWMPTQSQLDAFECRHGMGYSTISGKKDGIAASTRYFVPLDENLEIWQVTLANERLAAAEISVFSSVEFCLWEANDDATNFQRNFNTGEVEVEDGVIYHKTEYRERRNHFAWFACSGRWRSSARTSAWRGWDGRGSRGGRSQFDRHGWSPVAHVKCGWPGESGVLFVLGYWRTPRRVHPRR
jgi:cellobiose phosphorylase